MNYELYLIKNWGQIQSEASQLYANTSKTHTHKTFFYIFSKVSVTECIWDLDWTLVNKSDDTFVSLLIWILLSWLAEKLSKIVPSYVISNCQIMLCPSKSLIHTVFVALSLTTIRLPSRLNSRGIAWNITGLHNPFTNHLVIFHTLNYLQTKCKLLTLDDKF